MESTLREKFTANIALLDQAIAPLKNAQTSLTEIVNAELGDTEKAGYDLDNKENADRRDRVVDFKYHLSDLNEMVDFLGKLKERIENYEK